MAAFGHHDLHNVAGWQSTQIDMADRTFQSGSVARLDYRVVSVGLIAHEPSALVRVRTKSPEMEQPHMTRAQSLFAAICMFALIMGPFLAWGMR